MVKKVKPVDDGFVGFGKFRVPFGAMSSGERFASSGNAPLIERKILLRSAPEGIFSKDFVQRKKICEVHYDELPRDLENIFKVILGDDRLGKLLKKKIRFRVEFGKRDGFQYIDAVKLRVGDRRNMEEFDLELKDWQLHLMDCFDCDGGCQLMKERFLIEDVRVDIFREKKRIMCLAEMERRSGVLELPFWLVDPFVKEVTDRPEFYHDNIVKNGLPKLK
jgi:hypothetical protein